jgi:hypothetical protein
MEWWTRIRLEVLRGERSKREVLRREGIHWETLKRILEHSEPPGYRMKQARPKPKIGPYLERIARIMEQDKALPKKQRHTAKRIYERIGEMGYGGKYTQVREVVREPRGVHAVDSPAGRGTGGFWLCTGEGLWGIEEGRFFCDGTALLRCLFCDGL